MNHKPDAPEQFDTPYLSPAGQDRADQILGIAIQEATRRRRYRRARQSAALALLAATGLSLWTSTHSRTSPPPAVVVSPPYPAPPPATPAGNTPVLTHIYTDPHILTQLRLTPQPPQWQTITDDQLLTTLASAGHPAAIIPLNGTPTLLLAASDKP